MGEATQEDESSILTIHNVTRAHSGLYQCTASNGIALPAYVDVKLVVQCKLAEIIFSVRQKENIQKIYMMYICLYKYTHAISDLIQDSRISDLRMTSHPT